MTDEELWDACRNPHAPVGSFEWAVAQQAQGLSVEWYSERYKLWELVRSTLSEHAPVDWSVDGKPVVFRCRDEVPPVYATFIDPAFEPGAQSAYYNRMLSEVLA